MKSYRELIVWQRSLELVIEIYLLTKKFPASELYGLISQIRRAAVSIPSNIAEGYCRGSRKEFAQFINIAFASGAELETQLFLAKSLNFCDVAHFKKSEDLLEEVMKMLNALLKKLRQ